MKTKTLSYFIAIAALIMSVVSACNSVSPTVKSTTPIPTLQNDQKMEQVEDLLVNNKNCKLPCWWGIIPGQTEWQASEKFLGTIARDMNSFESQGNVFHIAIFSVPENIAFSKELWHRYNEQNGIVESIEIDPGRSIVYSLPNVLMNYGQPDEVWISWINTKPNSKGYFPVFVNLYYRSQGILVEYMPNRLTIKNKNTVIACPQNYEFPKIFVWSTKAKNDYSFERIFEQTEFLNGKELSYLSLEEATGMTLERFYSTFKNVDNTTCIETRIDLWPKGKNPFE